MLLRNSITLREIKHRRRLLDALYLKFTTNSRNIYNKYYFTYFALNNSIPMCIKFELVNVTVSANLLVLRKRPKCTYIHTYILDEYIYFLPRSETFTTL